MADLTITAANVIAGTNAVVERGVAGATITAGQPVYKEAASSKYKLADNDSVATGATTPRGIALHGASDGQPLDIQTDGDITIGATMTAGVAYYLSATAGGICPVGDLGSGKTVSLIGVSISTTVLRMGLLASGVAL